jgi:hypothetical protein
MLPPPQLPPALQTALAETPLALLRLELEQQVS